MRSSQEVFFWGGVHECNVTDHVTLVNREKKRMIKICILRNEICTLCFVSLAMGEAMKIVRSYFEETLILHW